MYSSTNSSDVTQEFDFALVMTVFFGNVATVDEVGACSRYVMIPSRGVCFRVIEINNILVVRNCC